MESWVLTELSFTPTASNSTVQNDSCSIFQVGTYAYSCNNTVHT